MSENPYAAPDASTEWENHASDDERIRRQHLNAEASIRSIGSLFMAAGVLGAFRASRDLLNLTGGDEALVMFLASALSLSLGIGLRKLRHGATIIAGVPAGLGLFYFPVGTVVCTLILYFLFSKKACFVVTPVYREIIRSTPHIRYGTSLFIWILLLSLILLVLSGGFIFVTSR